MRARTSAALVVIFWAMSLAGAQPQGTEAAVSRGKVALRGCVFMKEVKIFPNITAPREFNRTPEILPASINLENHSSTPVKTSSVPAGTGSSESSVFNERAYSDYVECVLKSGSIVLQGSLYVLACGTIRGVGTPGNQ